MIYAEIRTTPREITVDEYLSEKEGIDIIIMIVVLAILIGIAILFRDKLGAFVDKLFDEILAFRRDCYEPF